MYYKPRPAISIPALALLGPTAPVQAYGPGPTAGDLAWGLIVLAVTVLGPLALYYALQRKTSAAMAQLQAKDENFDQALFIANVSVLFFMIRRAWCRRDLEPMRAFLSGALFFSLSEDAAEHSRSRTFSRLDDSRLKRPAITAVRLGADYDMIQVRLRSRAKSYVLDEHGWLLDGNARITTPLDEQWSFVRPAQASASPGQHRQQVHCPACGAPAKIGRRGECRRCQTPLSIAEFDWTLAAMAPINVPSGPSACHSGAQFMDNPFEIRCKRW